MMKLAIIGSRTITDKNLVFDLIANEITKYHITKIVSGVANGPDKIGIEYARENNIPYEEFLPDWEQYGKSAGFIRNQTIIDNADIILAIWDGTSKGTLDSINKAFKHKDLKIVIVYKLPSE